MGIWQRLTGQAAEPDPIDQTGPATAYPTRTGYSGDHAEQPPAKPQGADGKRARMDLNRGRRWTR